MTSSDARGDNYRWQIEVVTPNAEGTTSGYDQSEVTQSNDFYIAQGVLGVAFACTMCAAHCLALMVATRVSVALAPIPLIIIAHVLYFVIYAIKKCGFAPERCDVLTKVVEVVGLVGNLFKPRPVFIPSAQALLENAASILPASSSD